MAFVSLFIGKQVVLVASVSTYISQCTGEGRNMVILPAAKCACISVLWPEFWKKLPEGFG